MKSPASTRAYEHATLAFGLVTIPISVFTGTAKDTGISRKWFTADDHEVGYITVDKVTGENIERSEILNKISTEHGYVFVEDHEIEHLLDLTPRTVAIKSFQPDTLFNTAYIPKSPYFVEASKMKVGTKKVANKPAEQALALILAAMKEEGAIALVEFTTRGIPKPAVLLSDGTLWCVYHDEELREQRAMPDVPLSPALIEQGRGLIRALWSDDAVELTDERSALIQAFADEKALAGDFAKPETPALVVVQDEAPDDLMALLAASVAAAKAA